MYTNSFCTQCKYVSEASTKKGLEVHPDWFQYKLTTWHSVFAWMRYYLQPFHTGGTVVNTNKSFKMAMLCVVGKLRNLCDPFFITFVKDAYHVCVLSAEEPAWRIPTRHSTNNRKTNQRNKSINQRVHVIYTHVCKHSTIYLQITGNYRFSFDRVLWGIQELST